MENPKTIGDLVKMINNMEPMHIEWGGFAWRRHLFVECENGVVRNAYTQYLADDLYEREKEENNGSE